MVYQKTENGTLTEVNWDETFHNSSVEKAYQALIETLSERVQTAKKDQPIIETEEYRILAPLTKAEHQLFADYTGRALTEKNGAETFEFKSDEEREQLTNLLRESLSNLSPLTQLTVNHVKSVVLPDYAKEDADCTISFNDLPLAIAKRLTSERKEMHPKFAINIGQIAQQSIGEYLTKQEQLKFKANLEALDLDNSIKLIQRYAEGNELYPEDLQKNGLVLLPHCDYNKTPEGLKKIYSILHPKQEKSQTKLTLDKVENYAGIAAMGLMTAGALASMMPESKPEPKPKPESGQQDGKHVGALTGQTYKRETAVPQTKKGGISFTKVISVAGALATTIWGSLWLYRQLSNGGKQDPPGSPQTQRETVSR